ncbi:STAS domain-containing protein [Noviherbaspirillum agri]
MRARNKDIVAPLRLRGELTIFRAVELKRTLMAPLHEGVILEANLAEVTEIDATGLQLLMLARKAAQERGGELRLVEHSAAVIDVLELLHLTDWFGEPAPLAAAEGMRNAG